jgi:hypothetical protein
MSEGTVEYGLVSGQYTHKATGTAHFLKLQTLSNAKF